MCNETVDLMCYDDGTGLLLVLKGGLVFAYDTRCSRQSNGDQLKFTYPLEAGPTVLALRCSLDCALLAVQRSNVLLEFIDLATNNIFVHASRKGKDDVLGFFFTELAESEVVFVTSGGLEVNTYAAQRRGLRLRERRKMSVAWYLYTHETRMVLVGTGPQGSHIHGWQFAGTGLVTLPMFTIEPAKSPTSIASIITANHVRLIKLYGRVYCAYINRELSRLELYRFFTDTVPLQHSYEVFSPFIDISQVDNVLVVHHLDSAVAMLLDVMADTHQPLAAPLPLALPQPPGEAPQNAPPPAPAAAPPLTALAAWRFYAPNVVLDLANHRLHRLYLDVKALVNSCSDPSLLAGFILRRRPPVLPFLACQPKILLVNVIKNAVQEGLPLNVLRKVFDDVVQAYAAALQAGPEAQAQLAHVLSPDDMVEAVFKWLHQEEVVDAPYLQAALTEFKCAAERAGVLLPPALNTLSLDILAQQGQDHQVNQMLYCQGLHVGATALLAMRAAASPGSGGPAAQPGTAGTAAAGSAAAQPAVSVPQLPAAQLTDMAVGAAVREAAALKVTAPLVAAVRALLAQGAVMRALRLAREHHVITAVKPREYLQAVARLNDVSLMAAVLRCLAQHCAPQEVPSLQQAITLFSCTPPTTTTPPPTTATGA